MAPKVKICGVTSAQDAEAAVAAGASYIGVIFVASSPRRVPIEFAKDIRKAIGKSAQLVGIFQNTTLEDINHHIQEVGLDLVQLHGNETPEFCGAIKIPTMKVFSLDFETQRLQPAQIAPYLRSCRFIMIDKPKGYAGTDWLTNALNAVASHESTFPEYFFAGGLNTENLSNVLDQISPYCVDVASGIETSVGKKDHKAMADFCSQVLHTTLGAFNN
jgi:phosphoribosylanthranilate isomerase